MTSDELLKENVSKLRLAEVGSLLAFGEKRQAWRLIEKSYFLVFLLFPHQFVLCTEKNSILRLRMLLSAQSSALGNNSCQGTC